MKQVRQNALPVFCVNRLTLINKYLFPAFRARICAFRAQIYTNSKRDDNIQYVVLRLSFLTKKINRI